LKLATFDSDKSYIIELKHDDKLDEKSETVLQTALLYTTSSGQRRIRVFNMSLPVTAVLSNIFRSADLDSIVNFLSRTTLNEVTKMNMYQLRMNLTEKCVEILYAYRKFCATSSSPGQLILPEALKLLPVFVLAVQKNALMRPGTDVHADERSFLLHLINHLSPTLTTPLLYPRMYALHTITSGEYGQAIDAEGNVKLPPLVRPSSESLVSEGSFLLEDGQKIYIWLGKALPQKFVQELFVTETYNTPYITMLPANPEAPTQLSTRIHGIISTLRRQRQSFLQTIFIRQGEAGEARFFSYMVEDKALDTMNYVDYLCHIHRQIQSKLQ